ncbi:MAG TPA: hypothetical protein VIU35_00105, partial [Chitinophagaceae bacterium]
MQGIFTRSLVCLLTIFIVIGCNQAQSNNPTQVAEGVSQDSTVYKWNYKSKKTGEGKYDLIFTTSGVKDWQLYSPNHEFDGKKSAKLEFKDSSIVVENVNESGELKTLLSPIFEDTVKIYEGQTEWKIPISV